MESTAPGEWLKTLGLRVPAPSLTPMHGVPAANEPMQLYEGLIELEVSSERFALAGTIVYEWHPYPRIRMYATSTRDFPTDVANATIAIPALQLRAECLLSVSLQFDQETGRRYSIRGLVVSPLRGGSLDSATSVKGYIPNLPEILGSPVAREEGNQLRVRRARTVLAAAPWRIILDEVAEAESTRKEIAANGGFGFTHLCEITRTDGAGLAEQDVLDLQEDLHLFFSFLRGFHCSPTLLEATDAAGEVCWRSWDRRPQEHWKTVWEWLPLFEPTAAVDIFPGFMARRTNPMWRQPLQRAVHWYVSGNTFAGGSAGAIVLAQSALELLAWEYLRDSNMPKRRGQNRQHAPDKIRALLEWAGIPLPIPPGLVHLARAGTWTNCAHALTSVRNSIVHPERRNGALQTDEVLQESWRLSLELLELVIFRLCNYHGNFHSRVLANPMAADTSPVPWQSRARKTQADSQP